MSDRKIIRKMTFHIYEDNCHATTQSTGIYEGGEDPFKDCTTLKEVREVFLTTAKKPLEQAFKEYDNEKIDFVLAKINKRNLSIFQKFSKYELSNTGSFVMED
jgi:hypothetical protein